MSGQKRIYPIIIGAGVVFVGVILGFFLGRTPDDSDPASERDETPPPFTQSSAHATPEAEPSETPYVGIYYTVQSQDGHLNIYEVDGEKKTLIKSVEFDLELLPQSDKMTLEMGIQVPNLEEGFQLIEDFTS